ncbi:beta-glucoside-specific PTS transporter subunit IIABC [Intestinibacter sp.]
MDYRNLATQILEYIGGENNVSHFEHCSTRLRFTLKDSNKVKVEELKQTKGVLGVVMAAQCQIIIGNNVVEVYDEILKIASFNHKGSVEAPKQDQKLGAKIMDFVIGVFQPLVPAIAGAGVLKSIISLFVLFGLLDNTSVAYTVFNNIGDAALYFIPLLVANSAAKKLKCNQMVAIAAVGTLLLPNITTLLATEGGAKLFGITLESIAYAYQIFPALLTVFLLAFVEKLFNKITPKPIRIFFVPMMCYVIVLPCTLLFLGPLGYNIGTLLTTIILTIYAKVGFIGIGLFAMLLPLCVATGMHKAFLPYAISTYSETGKEFVYMPASLAHNIAESGACFAVAIKSKDTETRSTAVSAGISALFGITEPALYGLTLQNKKILGSVMVGAGISGLFLGLFAVEAFVVVGPGLASMSMFVNPDNNMNFIYAVIGFVAAFAVSFIAAMILYKDETVEASIDNKIATNALNTNNKIVEEDVTLESPLTGKIIKMEDVNDSVFAGKILGDGVAIIPSEGVLKSPGNGKVSMIADTKHSIGLTLDNGTEVLIHIGLDTVKLDGKYYDVKVSNGQTVKTGDNLIEFDINNIKSEGYELTTPVIVVNGDKYGIENTKTGSVKTGEILFDAIKMEA